MDAYEFTFAIDDILSRRGDFLRDIRSASGVKGHIAECKPLSAEDAGNINARLWMPSFSGDRYYVLTVTAFFDPCLVLDIIIVPEFKLSFYYSWDNADFNTEKLMSVIDKLCKAKASDAELHEWVYLSVAAAVCAVYEHMGRIRFVEPDSDIAHEHIVVMDVLELIESFNMRKYC